MEYTGTFTVSMEPQPSAFTGESGVDIGQMLLQKSFSGDLQGESSGVMFTARTPTAGAAGYVAIEQFSGSLDGRSGTFVLQHFGVMADGNNRLILEIVPHSGTGELSGISGKMELEHREGAVAYRLQVD